MIDKQPEALRLADWFESFYLPTSTQAKAAAELRRLHTLNVELESALRMTLAQCLLWQGEPDKWSCSIHNFIVQQARAAIDKSEGTNHD